MNSGQTHQTKTLEPPLAGQPVPLGSSFYMSCPAEADCLSAIAHPGALIRIKGAQQVGKTSLVLRILQQAHQQDCRTVWLSFHAFEVEVLQDVDLFLQEFCRQISNALQLPDCLSDYWDDLFGSSISCKSYFEEYLLPQIAQPFVLALDDIDRLFAYPDLADEFFGLLRAWHEDAKSREVWQQLRLIVVHSTEVYVPLNLNKSPFNVGLPIELENLTPDQMARLAERYGLDQSTVPLDTLMAWTGGQPYLVQLALDALRSQPDLLDNPVQTYTTPDSLYYDHLQRQEQVLVSEPALAAALAQVMQQSTPVELRPTEAFRLQSLGLLSLQGYQARPSCDLYAQYFRDRLP